MQNKKVIVGNEINQCDMSGGVCECGVGAMLSPMQMSECVGCEGRGWIATADGPEDFEKVEHEACDGKGRVFTQKLPPCLN